MLLPALRSAIVEQLPDSNGDTVEFYFSKDRDLKAAKRFICKALARHG